MQPKILCQNCSHELKPNDKFCSSCGAKVDWGETPAREPQQQSPPKPAPKKNGAPGKCPLCGNTNPPENAFCESCGAKLASGDGDKNAGTAGDKKMPAGSVPLRTLQSWKLTVSMAVLLILVVISLKYLRSSDAPQQQQQSTEPTNANPHGSQAALDEINALQKIVDANPNDAQSMLQLANKLEDAKFYQKAIPTYMKYLELNPSDVNAQVDLGVTNFEMSMVDSSQQSQYLMNAEINFKKALEKNPRHQLALYNMGIITLQHGDMSGAAEWFRKAIAIDSTNEVAKKATYLLQQHVNTKPS
jgi:uncharacterized membrane protein YvbJ